jgi:hypothetical protein
VCPAGGGDAKNVNELGVLEHEGGEARLPIMFDPCCLFNIQNGLRKEMTQGNEA